MNKPNNNTIISHHVVALSVVGRRRSMEEEVTIEPGMFHLARADGQELRAYDFFGVYNGRGSQTAAKRCKERLHHVVAEQSHSHSHAVGVVHCWEWESVMVSSFATMNIIIDEFGSYTRQGDDLSLAEVAKHRSMALVALVAEEEIVVANSGNSRAVLCSACVADAASVPLCCHHQRERPGEEEGSGGRGRVKEEMMISTPEVTVHKRSILDDFLIIATNGLWNVVTNEMACDIVKKRCSKEATTSKKENKVLLDGDGVIRNVADDCAAMLVELALSRGSKDNISVIVVELQHLTNHSTTSSP